MEITSNAPVKVVVNMKKRGLRDPNNTISAWLCSRESGGLYLNTKRDARESAKTFDSHDLAREALETIISPLDGLSYSLMDV